MNPVKKIVVTVSLMVSIIAALPMQVSAKEASYKKDSIEAQILEGINAERKAAGLGQLKYDSDMDKGAHTRASEATKKWSHTRPNGKEYWTADEDHIYGENLAKDYSSADAIIAAWMASPSHKDNILFADFKTAAIGVVKASNGTYTVALEFGY